MADPTHNDIVTDNDFYESAVLFNGVNEQKPYENNYILFGGGLGLGGIVNGLNMAYTSDDVKPWAVLILAQLLMSGTRHFPIQVLLLESQVVMQH